MSALGARIKLLREQCDFTQEQLAEMLGITSAAVSAYELGINTPPSQKLYHLASILHTTPAYLLDREEPRTINVSDLTESQEAAVRRTVEEFTKANNT